MQVLDLDEFTHKQNQINVEYKKLCQILTRSYYDKQKSFKLNCTVDNLDWIAYVNGNNLIYLVLCKDIEDSVISDYFKKIDMVI